MDVGHLNFSKICDVFSLTILVPKLGHYVLEGQTNRWVKHQLDDRAEKAVVKGSYPT